MFADLARARSLAFFFVVGLGLMVACDLCAVVETPRDAVLGEGLHLIGLGVLVTGMLQGFNATLGNARAARAVSVFCIGYLAWHVVVLLRMALG